MDKIKAAQESINNIQDQLIEYLSAGEDTQDLTNLFSKLSVENSTAYELTLLMYQELHTKSKMDRKKLTKVISQLLQQNHVALEKLVQHDQKINESTPVATGTQATAATATTATTATPAPTGMWGAILSPKIIYAVCTLVVIVFGTLGILSIYFPELFDIVIAILKKLAGLSAEKKDNI